MAACSVAAVATQSHVTCPLWTPRERENERTDANSLWDGPQPVLTGEGTAGPDEALFEELFASEFGAAPGHLCARRV